jgi:hypothetical protein
LSCEKRPGNKDKDKDKLLNWRWSITKIKDANSSNTINTTSDRAEKSDSSRKRTPASIDQAMTSISTYKHQKESGRMCWELLAGMGIPVEAWPDITRRRC